MSFLSITPIAAKPIQPLLSIGSHCPPYRRCIGADADGKRTIAYERVGSGEFAFQNVYPRCEWTPTVAVRREAVECAAARFAPVFAPNGAIYVFRVSEFNARGGFPSNGSMPFAMNANDSLDIDTEDDICRAEIILGGK